MDVYLALREKIVVVFLKTKLQRTAILNSPVYTNPQSNLYSSLCPYEMTMSVNSFITVDAQQFIRLSAR